MRPARRTVRCRCSNATWPGSPTTAATWTARALRRRRRWQAIGRSRHVGSADTLNLLGAIAMDAADAETARSLLEEALALRVPDDHHGRALSLHNLARIALRGGDLETARRLYEESLAERRAGGDARGAAETLNSLGVVAYQQGDIAAARRLYEESLSHYRALGDRPGAALLFHNLGEIAEQDGENARAVLFFVHAERIFRDLQSPMAAAPAEALGRLATAMGADSFAAARHVADATDAETISFEAADQCG